MRPKTDESGAVAVIYALMVVMLISIAALATDLGNAVSRKTTTQTQADFSAYEVAQQLTDTGRAGDTVTSGMKDNVAQSLNNNQPQWDSNPCWRNNPVDCVTPAMLDDGDLTNGELRFTSLGLQVVSPAAQVDFGLAAVMGFSSTTVSSAATVNVFSPGFRVLPMFAVSGCDYGLQTLTDPAQGHVNTIVPTLAFDTDTDGQAMNLITTATPPVSPTLRNDMGVVVDALAYNSTGNVLEIRSSKWSNVSKFGFFRGDNDDPTLVQTQENFWALGDASHTSLAVPPATYSEPSGATTIAMNIPDDVADVETVWYVRAFDAVKGKWSDRAEAVPIRVGASVLQCGAGSNGGNFGTLRLGRTDTTPANYVPVNIAEGLQDPLNLHVHEEARTNTALSVCADGVNNARESDWQTPELLEDTNCVETDPGLPAGVATAGLITGADGHKGLLADEPTAPNCDPNGGSGERTMNLNGDSYTINNDTLTCFLLAGKSILDIAKDDAHFIEGDYLDPAIFDSPRFAYVPVFRTAPNAGADTYSIIGFRGAFITDEPAEATAVKGSHLGTADNGLITGTSQGQDSVTQMKVVFFNIKALPHDAGVPVMDYLGVGHKEIRLIQ